MLRNRYILRSISKMVTEAGKQTLADLNEGWVEQEPAFTDRLLTNLQNQLDGKTIKGIYWKAKTLTDRGIRAQEKTFGADFLGVLHLDLKGLYVIKGFFAQAKYIRRRREEMGAKEFGRFKQQCRKMLKVTPDSFVFLYSKSSIKIIPACSVTGTSSENLKTLSNRTIGRFFAEYLECFIGDPKLNAPSLDKFYEIANQYKITKGLYLHGSDEGDLNEPNISPIMESQTLKPTDNAPEKNCTQKGSQYQQSVVKQPDRIPNWLVR